MGFFDFLSSKSTPGKVAKATKRMLNEHHQQQVRQESIDELISYGTPDAIEGLVKRLGVNFRDTIKNEQEKRYVQEALVDHFGERSIEPLVSFIRSDQAISSAIRTLAQLLDAERLCELLVETLKGYLPEDHRTIAARLQLVDALSDLDDSRVVPTILPYTMDHDDDVRIKVMELLERRVTEGHAYYAETVARFLEVIEDPEASGRLARRAAEALMVVGADLKAHAARLTDAMPDGYRLSAEGKMERL